MLTVSASAWSIAGGMGAIAGTMWAAETSAWTVWAQCRLLQPLRGCHRYCVGHCSIHVGCTANTWAVTTSMWTITFSVQAVEASMWAITASAWSITASIRDAKSSAWAIVASVLTVASPDSAIVMQGTKTRKIYEKCKKKHLSTQKIYKKKAKISFIRSEKL